MSVAIALSEAADEPAMAVALQGLSGFNAPFVGAHGYKPLSLLVRRPGETAVAGGFFGGCYAAWFYLRYAYLPEDLRGGGLGARLLAQLEREARARGCVGAWVDTFSFQAPGFYERQGYERFGRLDDSPPGMARLFYRKRFSEGDA